MKLSTFKASFVKTFNTAMSTCKKKSPEICIAVGIAAAAGAIVTACVATKKVDKVVEEAKQAIENVHENDAQGVYETEKDYKRDLTKAYIKAGTKVTLLYLPSALLFATSVTLNLKGHSIMKRRNIEITTAYATLQKAYDKYRDRVKNEVGEEKERELFNDISTVKKEIVEPETGKKKVVEEKQCNYDGVSLTSRFFDRGSSMFETNPHYRENNMTAIMSAQKAIQFEVNQLRDDKTAVPVSRVYKILDLGDPTVASNSRGWSKGDIVDFGIYNVKVPSNRDFVNLRDGADAILLTFNDHDISECYARQEDPAEIIDIIKGKCALAKINVREYE